MKGNKNLACPEYVCPEERCTFHWRVQDGYFQVKDGVIRYPPEAQQYLKPALVSEHGYLYIASVEGLPPVRTWRCAVQDCSNTIVEEA
jgi:hypothetical protein